MSEVSRLLRIGAAAAHGGCGPGLTGLGRPAAGAGGPAGPVVAGPLSAAATGRPRRLESEADLPSRPPMPDRPGY